MIRTWLIALIFTAQSLWASPIDSLRFITEDYPPFNYEGDRGELQGYAVEIAQAIFDRMQSRQSVESIELLPWARGYDLALTQPDVVLFSTTRTPAREALFQWVGPIAPSRVVLLAKTDRAIEIAQPEAIERYRIGVIREDIGHQRLLELGVSPDRLVIAASNTEAAQLIERDRVDLWAYGEYVGYWLLEELGYNPNDYAPVYTLSESHYYFAISQKSDPAIARAMQAALDGLKADGTVERILQDR